MMREFRYKIFNPGGNKTALVFGNNYSNYEKARINQIINSKEYIQKIQTNSEKTKVELKKIMKNIDTEQKAIGVILLEEFKEFFKIYPIVWVKTIDTLYYETACGSGSLAVTIYKNYITNKSNFEIL